MFDYINYINRIVDTEILLKRFKPEVYIGLNSGCIKYPIKWFDGPLELQICQESKSSLSYFKISGSLHMYYNFIRVKKAFNYNDFTLKQIEETLRFLSRKYDFKLCDGYLNSLEFGFNIRTKISPSSIIYNNVILHKEKQHSILNEYNGKGLLKAFICSEFKLKFYDKSKKEKLNYNLLRIEIKLKAKKILQRYSINNLTDLYNKKSISILGKYFFKQLSETTIIDDIDPKLLPKDALLFRQFTIEQTHYKMKNNYTRAGIKKRKEHFKRIVRVNGLDKCELMIKTRLSTKYEQLLES